LNCEPKFLIAIIFEGSHSPPSGRISRSYMSPLGASVTKLRTSLYADDATVFLNPVKEEVQVVADILHMFGQASGLFINISKCAVFPIRYSDVRGTI
jgi:hypothetical protein